MSRDEGHQTNGAAALADADAGVRRMARVYAEALLDAADHHQAGDTVAAELAALVGDVFRAQPVLEAMLASPAVPRDKKEEMIQRAFEGKASETFLNFLLVLNRHGRLAMLAPIWGAFQEMRDERGHRTRVLVRSAVPLPDDQKESLRQELRARLGQEPVLDLRIDPELLGGLVVQVGDVVHDYSIRARLRTIQTQLLARSSHEIQHRRDRFRPDGGNR